MVLIFLHFIENLVMDQGWFKSSLFPSQSHNFTDEDIETWRMEGTWLRFPPRHWQQGWD